MGVSFTHFKFCALKHKSSFKQQQIDLRRKLYLQQQRKQSVICHACRTFADGFPNLFVKDATRIRNRHVAFLASFQHPITIFEQLSIIYQLPRMFVGSFTVVLPYFPTGTAERVCMLLTAFSMLHTCSTSLHEPAD